MPTLLVVIFASLLFQSGTQFWFSERARTVLTVLGWQVQSVDGRDHEAISRALAAARAEIARVVEKFVLQLELQLAEQNVHIQFDSDAREWLAKRGYDKLMGARPMARLIQEKVKQPLAEELLFGKLAHGGEAKVRRMLREAVRRCSFEMRPCPACDGGRRASWGTV